MQQYLLQGSSFSFCSRNEAVSRVYLMSNLWAIFKIQFGNVFPLFWTSFILVWSTWPRTLKRRVPKLWHIYNLKMAAIQKMKKTSWLEVPVDHNELGYFRYIIWYMIGGSYGIKSHSSCNPSISRLLQGPPDVYCVSIDFHHFFLFNRTSFSWLSFSGPFMNWVCIVYS